MNPELLGEKYDKIADWWHQIHHDGTYGMEAFSKALSFKKGIKNALDVGCGAGGRFVSKLTSMDCMVHGIDVSAKMIALAQANHPDQIFEVQDICSWQVGQSYDLVYAWDSLFHLPFTEHRSVIKKLCSALQPEGILFYTFGDAVGEHTDEWMNDTFYYSSIGINENLRVLMECDLTILHLELDQYPESHVVVIAQKRKTDFEQE